MQSIYLSSLLGSGPICVGSKGFHHRLQVPLQGLYLVQRSSMPSLRFRRPSRQSRYVPAWDDPMQERDLVRIMLEIIGARLCGDSGWAVEHLVTVTTEF